MQWDLGTGIMAKGNGIREVSLDEQDVGAGSWSIDVIQSCGVDEVWVGIKSKIWRENNVANDMEVGKYRPQRGSDEFFELPAPSVTLGGRFDWGG